MYIPMSWLGCANPQLDAHPPSVSPCGVMQQEVPQQMCSTWYNFCKALRAPYAGLKQVLKAAEAGTSRLLKRGADWSTADNLNDPMTDPQQAAVELACAASYRIFGVPRKLGTDSQLGRIQREFTHQQPSMCSMTKVRPVAQSQKTVGGEDT